MLASGISSPFDPAAFLGEGEGTAEGGTAEWTESGGFAPEASVARVWRWSACAVPFGSNTATVAEHRRRNFEYVQGPSSLVVPFFVYCQGVDWCVQVGRV